MTIPSRNGATFCTQANALLRKNLTFQKRNVKTNVRLILFPVILLLLLFAIQKIIDSQFDKPEFKCGCVCANDTTKDSSQCPNQDKLCGVQYSDPTQAATCSIPNPSPWPPLLQLPSSFSDSSPLTLLFTAHNQSFAQNVSANMFGSSLTISRNATDIFASLAMNVLGSESTPSSTNFIEPAFSSGLPIYYLQTKCTGMDESGIPLPIADSGMEHPCIANVPCKM